MARRLSEHNRAAARRLVIARAKFRTLIEADSSVGPIRVIRCPPAPLVPRFQKS